MVTTGSWDLGTKIQTEIRKGNQPRSEPMEGEKEVGVEAHLQQPFTGAAFSWESQKE